MPTTRSASNAKQSSSSNVDANIKKNSGRPTLKNRSHNEGKDDSLPDVKVKELELEVRRLKKVTRFTLQTTGVVLT